MRERWRIFTLQNLIEVRFRQSGDKRWMAHPCFSIDRREPPVIVDSRMIILVGQVEAKGLELKIDAPVELPRGGSRSIPDRARD